MIGLNSKTEELYTKDGKELFELIQEWINENGSFLYCKSEEKNIEYNCR